MTNTFYTGCRIVIKSNQSRILLLDHVIIILGGTQCVYEDSKWCVTLLIYVLYMMNIQINNRYIGPSNKIVLPYLLYFSGLKMYKFHCSNFRFCRLTLPIKKLTIGCE